MSDNAPKPIKLPYFHRTLSPEDRALIGDTTPKPIQVSSLGEESQPTNSSVLSGSAWNSAQTWEERDCTSWGKAKVRELFEENYPVADDVELNNVSKLEGSASVTHVRGRARFLYEWSFSVDFSVPHNGKKITGSVDVSEAINDQLDDVVFSMKWKGGVSRDVQKILEKRIQGAVLSRVRDFEAHFREYKP